MQRTERNLAPAWGSAPGGERRSVSMRRTLLLILAGVALAAAAAVAVFPRPWQSQPAALSYTELGQALEGGRVAALLVRPGDRVDGWWAPLGGRTGRAADFSVVYPLERADVLVERAEQAGVQVSFGSARAAERWRSFLGIGLQLLIFAVLGYFIYQHTRGQGRGDVGRESLRPTTGFKDVGGTQGASEELQELVEFLRHPEAFATLGARVPKGVLLVGPPGTGKTLLARAVAGEAGVPFFHISGSEITGFIVGMGAQRIRTLFRKARKRGGVIFIDEVDSLGGVRGRNRSHNEDDRTLNQLLVEMDGFSPSDGVVVLAATNRPEDLDPALKRPGRFDRIVSVALPSADGREEILRLHAEGRRVPLGDDVDLKRLARLTPQTSGADLANLINEAAIAAVRDRSDSVAWRHFESARDRMLLGKERVGFRARQREWRTVAWHEAGHALAGVVCCPEDGLHKVTIQPRGRAMGVAHFAPEDDRHLYSRRYMEGQIVKGLGGRAAEEIAFGAEHVTGGAESDLVHVNRIARQMIFRLGMGQAGGLLVADDQSAPLSADAQARMDDEVRVLLDRLYQRTLAVLTQHRAALDALATALIERETLDGAEALALFHAHGVETRMKDEG
jgi:cell division protease FtsH